MIRFLRRAACAGGFSAVETSAIVLGMSIVAATAGPQMQEYLDLARTTKANGDVRVLAVAMARLLVDVGSIRSVRGRGVVRPEILVGDGEPPATVAPGTEAWARPVADRATDSFNAHLVDNAAGYPEGPRAAGTWRGPYMDRVSADPWGNRYATNVSMLTRPPGLTIVVSAGADGRLETPFEARILQPAGDDIVAFVWASR